MKQPKVAALILTKDRPQYLARALKCLAAQTVKAMPIVIDASQPRCVPQNCLTIAGIKEIMYVTLHGSIGMLRNAARELAQGYDIIVHWDDDDYSFPGRIERQLEQLKPVHAVGWRELAFWDSTIQKSFKYYSGATRYACGTSLCYRVEEWQKNPFPDLQVGEDAAWCAKVKPYGMLNSYEFLVAEIHGKNTSSHVDPNAEEWTRTPSRDAHLAKVMAL